ncbi:MAG: C40 family peptidase [Coriobacteriales bacterium]|nr:C40 family peptidase [Coriobacteriales bacterium]
MKRLVTCALLTAAMLLACVAALIPNRSAQAVEIEAREVVEYMESRVGDDYNANWCLYFVRTSWQAMGGPESTTCCASKYGEEHVISSDMDNIPVGADVYFVGGSVHCDNCGRMAGHVGIYVGDGMMVHNYGSTIRKDPVAEVAHWGELQWLGWGFHGGISITGYVEDPTPIAIGQPKYELGQSATVVWGSSALADGYELEIIDPWGEPYLKMDVEPASDAVISGLKPGRYQVRVNASNFYWTLKGDYEPLQVDCPVLKGFSTDKMGNRFGYFNASAPQWTPDQGDNLIMMCSLHDYGMYHDALRMNGLEHTLLLAIPDDTLSDEQMDAVKGMGRTVVLMYGNPGSALMDQLEGFVGAGNVYLR